MTRQRLKAFSALALLALPASLVLIVTTTPVGADTQPPPIPAVSTSPAATTLNGQTGVQAGSPTGSGAAVTARPCTAPCSTTGSVNQDPQPVGVGAQTGHTAAGSADDSQIASAPQGSGSLLAGASGSGFA